MIRIKKPTAVSKSSKKTAGGAWDMHEKVQLQAYYNFLNRTRSGESGNEVSDWFEAEKAIQKQL